MVELRMDWTVTGGRLVALHWHPGWRWGPGY